MPIPSCVPGHYALVTREPTAEPLFLFDAAGDVSIEVKGKPLSVEAIDVSAGEYDVVYDLNGEQYRLHVDGHPEMGTVVLLPSGRQDPADLEARLRRAVSTWRTEVEDTGDLPLDVANAEMRSLWERRFPKRPRWLANRLHGESPRRFARP